MKKVLYEELLPEECVQRIQEMPVAYLPLGTLEWHGPHMPLGADGIQSKELFVRVAEKVGGVVVNIDENTHHNWLDLFYLYPNKHGKGLGLQIWRNIESKYPKTKVWRLITPYFEKRNVHFYVNKCGFKIVKFFNKVHRDPDRPISELSFHDEYFVFEKEMMP